MQVELAARRTEYTHVTRKISLLRQYSLIALQLAFKKVYLLIEARMVGDVLRIRESAEREKKPCSISTGKLDSMYHGIDPPHKPLNNERIDDPLKVKRLDGARLIELCHSLQIAEIRD